MGEILKGFLGGWFFGFLGYATFVAGLSLAARIFDLDKDQWLLAIFIIPFSLTWFAVAIFLWGLPLFNENASISSLICFYIAAIIPLKLSLAQLITFIKNREHFINFNL